HALAGRVLVGVAHQQPGRRQHQHGHVPAHLHRGVERRLMVDHVGDDGLVPDGRLDRVRDQGRVVTAALDRRAQTAHRRSGFPHGPILPCPGRDVHMPAPGRAVIAVLSGYGNGMDEKPLPTPKPAPPPTPDPAPPPGPSHRAPPGAGPRPPAPACRPRPAGAVPRAGPSRAPAGADAAGPAARPEPAGTRAGPRPARPGTRPGPTEPRTRPTTAPTRTPATSTRGLKPTRLHRPRAGGARGRGVRGCEHPGPAAERVT